MGFQQSLPRQEFASVRYGSSPACGPVVRIGRQTANSGQSPCPTARPEADAAVDAVAAYNQQQFRKDF